MSAPNELAPLRDPDELEGSLLPTAQLFHGEQDDSVQSASSLLPSATRVSISEGPFSGEDTIAVPIPSLERPNDPNEKILFEQGTITGKIQAEDEKAEIQKASRDVHAINYHVKEQISAANRVAQEKKYLEDSGQVQTSYTDATTAIQEHKKVQTPSSVEARHGTYGKEYEVKEYKVKEYKSGNDYVFSDYKSVYDR